MKNAHDVDGTAAHLIDLSTAPRGVSDALGGLSNLGNTRFCLPCIPTLLGEVPE